MAKREALSKKIRFEVFKRDKFTCQYCGRKAPEVILNCDHIDPVAGGGSNELINLITSCFDCNNGKRDRKLSDNTVIAKQRNQLEEVQKRREQIELMFEWKKSLESLDSDYCKMVCDYINSKIKPYSISDTGEIGIENLLRQFDVFEVLNGVDEGITNYIKYDSGGQVLPNTVERFLNKLGGVIAVQKMPPIKRKLTLLKGRAKYKFDQWDNRIASILLQKYVDTLKSKGLIESEILENLDSEISPMTRDVPIWEEWKMIIEKWTNDINEWEVRKQEIPISENELEYSKEFVQRGVDNDIERVSNVLFTIEYLAKPFKGFNFEEFIFNVKKSLLKFLDITEINSNEDPIDVIFKFIENEKLMSEFKNWKNFEFNDEVKSTFVKSINELLFQVFENHCHFTSFYDKEEVVMVNKILKKHYSLKNVLS